MRGKGSRLVLTSQPPWIIPAGAGKSVDRLPPCILIEDYPRGCGEKKAAAPERVANPGSSPRVRGKDEVVNHDALSGRIIPAGAGKSQSRPPRRRGRRDHPRGCGEKENCRKLFAIKGGSSPRVRGKAFRLLGFDGRVGIIPAGAGKSHPNPHSPKGSQDHPRGCGEKTWWGLLSELVAGSSPRVRGKGSRLVLTSQPPWIIPAGAGKSVPIRRAELLQQDHPRGCGEKRMAARRRRAAAGSSPRVRGKGKISAPFPCVAGIIPAGAGKRPSASSVPLGAGDHPRGCGEKRQAAEHAPRAPGSSPRVRGKYDRLFQGMDDRRIIPAGAGKSCVCGTLLHEERDHPRGCGEKQSF